MLVFGTQTDARRHGRNVITGQQQNPEGSCGGERVHARGRMSAGELGGPNGHDDRPIMIALLKCIHRVCAYRETRSTSANTQKQGARWPLSHKTVTADSCHVASVVASCGWQRATSPCHKNFAPGPLAPERLRPLRPSPHCSACFFTVVQVATTNRSTIAQLF